MAVLAISAPASQAADSCSNAAFRQGAGANLPDCRAYEQVSPVEKNGTSVTAFYNLAAASDGSKALFNSSSGIGGDDSVFLINPYVSTRGTGWGTQTVNPPQDTTNAFSNTATLAYSADLTAAAVVSRRALTPGAVEGGSNLYVRDLTQRSSYKLVVASTSGGFARDLFSYNNGALYTGSTGFAHLAFRTTRKLTNDPADPAAGPTRLYRWDDGDGLRVVSPDQGGSTGTQPPSSNVVSDDGRVTFAESTGGVLTLYQDLANGQRVTVSRSYRTGATAQDVRTFSSYNVGPGGSRVDFTSYEPLTDSSNDPNYHSIYRWNASAPGTATDLLAAQQFNANQVAAAKTLRGVSADGQYVYFFSNAVLAPGGTDNTPNLYALHLPDGQTTGSTVTFVATVESLDSGSSLRLSPDGSRIAFLSHAPINGYDNFNTVCNENIGSGDRCAEIWTYNAATPNTPITCASCPPAGVQPSANARIGQIQPQLNTADPRALTDDGRVYFDTGEQLSAQDGNDVSDVYEYSAAGGQRLISSGSGGNPATFGDISSSGDDVFIITADQLVAQDNDELRDVYDARVGGGFAAQQIPPAEAAAGCQASDCQGVPPASDSPTVPGTSTFSPFSPPRSTTFSVGKPSSSALRGLARSGRLAVSAKVGGAGTVKLRARAKVGRRTVTVGTASAKARRAGTLKLTLKLSRAARAELKKKRKLAVAVTVAFSKAGGDKTIRFTVQQPKAGSSKGGDR